MIQIFRRIRQRLITDNRFSKYLLYAFGEIILVVIGILIALQINNWNQYEKDRNTEVAYLNDLLEDFELNLFNSRKTIARIEAVTPRLIKLLEQSALDSTTLPLDTLNKYFSMINSMPAYMSTDRVYSNLIGSGDFKLISNPKLKTLIANYYKAYELIKLVQSTHEMELVNSFQPYIIENMDFQAVPMIRVNDFILPHPVEKDRILQVIRDREFRNTVTLKYSILTDLLEQNRDIEETCIELVANLKELVKL